MVVCFSRLCAIAKPGQFQLCGGEHLLDTLVRRTDTVRACAKLRGSVNAAIAGTGIFFRRDDVRNLLERSGVRSMAIQHLVQDIGDGMG